MTAKAGAAQTAGGQAGGASSPASINRAQRQAVLSRAVEMIQQIFTGTLATNQLSFLVPPRNVGLVKKFLVKITGTANNTDGANTAALSDLGLSNVLSQITFTDLNNNVRIQTTGWHLSFLNAMKNKQPMTDALQTLAFENAADTSFSQFSGSMGAVFPVIVAPTGFIHGTSQPFTMWYEVPLAYSDEDLRGAVYMNVVNAVAQLSLTPNPAPFAAAGADSTSAVWKGAAGNISGMTATVYQVYLDQLPMGKAGVILPSLDLSTVYELKNTPFSAIVQGTDFPMPYANFRDFLSTFAIFNDNPAADAGRETGGDVNYWALQSANFTNIFKVEPLLQAMKVRSMLGKDLPAGCYYFSSRRKPISTTTYGNMQLILNASSAAAGAYVLVAWEDFALVNTLLNAGSLAAS